MKKIIYSRADGGVSIVNLPPAAEDEDFDTEVARIVRDKLAIDKPAIVEEPRPDSRYFRDAWGRNGNGIVIDLPKARIIKTNFIRKERDEKLAALDIAYMRADEANDAPAKAEIAQRKQALRDLPDTIQSVLEAITTPEELEAFKPVWP